MDWNAGPDYSTDWTTGLKYYLVAGKNRVSTKSVKYQESRAVYFDRHDHRSQCIVKLVIMHAM